MLDIPLDSFISTLIVGIFGYICWLNTKELFHLQASRLYIIPGLILVALCNIAALTAFRNTAGITWMESIAGVLVGYIFLFLGSETNRSLLSLLTQNKGILKFQFQNCTFALQEANLQLEQQLEKNYQVLEELKISNQQFQSLLNSIPLPLIITDIKSKKTLFSNYFLERYLQTQEAEKKDEFILDIYNTLQSSDYVLNTLQKQGYLSNYETKLKKTNGNSFDALLSIRVINYEGKPAWFFIISDITERNQTQQMNILLATAVEYAAEAIEIIDAEARLEYVNPAFEKITGYTRAEVLGKTPASLLRSGRHDEAFYQTIWDTIYSGKVWNGCVISKRKDGTLCNQEVTLSPVRNGTGTISNYVCVRRDITEHQQVETEKQEFVSLVENSSEFIAMFSMEGKLLYLNEAGCKLVGLDSLEEALSKSIADYLPTDALAQFCEEILPTLKIKGRYESESQLRHFKTGELIDVHKSCFIVRHPQSDKPLCMATVQRDITERKRQEERLRLLERAIAASSNGIMITDASQPNNPIVYVNPGFEQITGYSVAEAIGKNSRFMHGNDKDQPALNDLRVAINRGEDCSVILRNYRKDGSLFWNELRVSPVYNASGQLTHFVGIQTDITDRKLTEEQLIHNAFHDALTGLPNRALFMDRLGQALAANKRYQDGQPYQFAVLFLDIDGFKTINDSLGHRVGDLLLIEFARRLEKCLRAEDTLARLGGDEFTILINGINKVRDAVMVAERIQREIALSFHLDENEVFISTSIGIVLSSTDYNCPGELLRDADTAMYRAKLQGKAQHVVFDIVMHNCAVARLQMENDLRWAIENQDFIVDYQPIMLLSTGKITGFEALVRWQHPEKGLISPAEFLPVAEEIGLCSAIDYWVLREACRQMSIWQKQFPDTEALTISVNLSSKHFWQPDFIKRIDKIIQETKLDTHSLKLEITETVIMKNNEAVTQTLLQLKERNIHLSIDDFGTGYSSLSYLHNFPIKNLKIDRSFINRMGANEKNLQIVQAIVTLAHQLEIDVTAEGVETTEQLHQLKEWQCEYAQGYLFHKPMNSKAAENLIAAERYQNIFPPKTSATFA